MKLRNRKTVVIACTTLLVASIAWFAYRNYYPPIPKAPVPANLRDLDPEVVILIEQTLSSVSKAPHKSHAWLKLGIVYHANEIHDLAGRCYEQAIALDRKDPRGWYFLALLREREGRTQDALVSLDQVVKRVPDFPPAHWRRGFVLLSLGQSAGAMSAFRRAVQLDPNDPAGAMGLARSLLDADGHVEAISILESWRDRAGEIRGYLMHLLGTAYQRAGRPADANAAFAQSNAEGPSWPDPWLRELGRFQPGYGAHIQNARQLIAKRQFLDAVMVLEDLYRRQPTNIVVMTNLGIAQRGLGEHEKSLRTLQRAVELKSSDFDARFNLAVTLAEMTEKHNAGNSSELIARALSEADVILSSNPDHSKARVLRGDLLVRHGRREEALQDYNAALRIEPNNARFLFRAGVVLIALNQAEKAVDVLKKAVQGSPSDSEIYRALATALVYANQLEEAATIIKQGETLRPNDARWFPVKEELQKRAAQKSPEGRAASHHSREAVQSPTGLPPQTKPAGGG